MSEGVEWLEKMHLFHQQKVLCLVDGEHYPPVTGWAVDAIQQKGGEIAGLVFLGGTEKIGGEVQDLFDTGQYPLYAEREHRELPISLIIKAVREQQPDLVVDLSDVPVIDYKKRFRIASAILNQQVIYAGADFVFRPPVQRDLLEKPAITIMGTGKRVGKTAVSITTSGILKQQNIHPAVIAMGRGGPAEPQVVDIQDVDITPEYLLQIVQEGKHAASDYWENAVLAGIPAIGCRRCGGGFAGNPFISNVAAGVRLANRMEVDIIIMEGSGPTLPPVKTGAKILVLGAHQPLEQVTGYLDEYRLLNADLVVVTMCEEPSAEREKVNTLFKAIQRINPDVEIALTVFRPQPVQDITGKNIFVATTAPEEAIGIIVSYLEEQYRCRVVGHSTQLSNRKKLHSDLHKHISDADLLLTEIKAASIDVAAQTAKEYKLQTVFMHNRPILTGGTVSSLEDAVLRACRKSSVFRKKFPKQEKKLR